MIMKSNYLLACVIGIFSMLASLGSQAQATAKLNTGEIYETTMSCTDCFDWKMIGVCFWLKCKLYSCSVKESMKVSHYIPDLMVSSYTSKSPWTDTQSWNKPKHGAMTTAESARKLESNLDFKSVDIITHPTLPVFNELGEEDYLCKSMHAMPYMPLFLSKDDPFWIQSTVEGVLASTMGIIPTSTNRIKGSSTGFGALPSYWAGVYPRCGWGNHPYDPINAAVAAHRASEIVTRTMQPHVYLATTGKCDNRCWKPSSVVANNSNNKFQMFYPESESSAKPMGGKVTWANGKQEIHEAYSWSLWRKYKCCKKKGQVFLFSVDWE
jgi:integrating conjugative element protein (TIGR03756 family)